MYRYPCADDAHNAQSNLQPPRPAPQVRDVVADNATCSPPSGAVRSLCRVRSVLMFRTLPLCTVYEQNRQSNHISLILLLLLLLWKDAISFYQDGFHCGIILDARFDIDSVCSRPQGVRVGHRRSHPQGCIQNDSPWGHR